MPLGQSLGSFLLFFKEATPMLPLAISKTCGPPSSMTSCQHDVLTRTPKSSPRSLVSLSLKVFSLSLLSLILHQYVLPPTLKQLYVCKACVWAPGDRVIHHYASEEERDGRRANDSRVSRSFRWRHIFLRQQILPTTEPAGRLAAGIRNGSHTTAVGLPGRCAPPLSLIKSKSKCLV